MIVDTNDLDKAYEAYSKNQIMRKDLFRIVCDHVIALEAAVKALADGEAERKMSANFLNSKVVEVGSRLDRLDEEIDSKIATAANSAIAIYRDMLSPQPMIGMNSSIPKPQPANPAVATEAKRRGRPPKQPEAVGG